MNRAQIQNIATLSKAVERAAQNLARRRSTLIIAKNKCDHRYANGRSAKRAVSTHSDRICGGYHECAVCAGEVQETFVETCQICKKSGEPFVQQPPLAKPIRL